MSGDNNSLAIKSLTGIYQPAYRAVGIPLAQLQNLVQIAGDETAPHFRQGEEPQDGRAVTATNGQAYYLPQLRVAQRQTPPQGPDVRFLKDVEEHVRLQFELEEAPLANLPATAKPLDVRVSQMQLQWLEAGQWRQRIFDQPSLVAIDNQQANTKPSFAIRTGTALTTAEVETIHAALSRADAQATLSVNLTYSYWVDKPSSETPPINPRLPLEERILPRLPLERIRPEMVMIPRAVNPALLRVTAARLDAPVMRELDSAITSASIAAIRADRISAPALEQLKRRDWEREVLDQQKIRQVRPEFQTRTLTRSLPFNFDPTLQQNKPIYSAIREGEALTEAWTQTPFGLVRKASFPNTIYRLPDKLQLLYNAELGMPHMIPTLYQADADSSPRVRVTLRAVPWHDAEQLTKLRDYLYSTSSGSLAAPNVVVGGYESAKFRLTAAFPEGIRLIDGEAKAITLEGGFEFTLDLSTEYYRYLGQLMVGPVGLIGEVEVTVQTIAATPTAAPEKQTYRIPVNLNLTNLASLPVEVTIDRVVSPRHLQVKNLTRSELQIKNCLPRLLQDDTNSVRPLAVFTAATVTPFPSVIAAGATLAVEVQPDDRYKDQLWNAMLVELVGQKLSQPAKEILDYIHEVAPQNSLPWKVEAECPLFVQPNPLPSEYQNLYRLEVKVARQGFAPQQIILTKQKPMAQVTMRRTLKEILSEEATSLTTFEYSVRNIYNTHQGQWSTAQIAEGNSFVIFPNPPD